MKQKIRTFTSRQGDVYLKPVRTIPKGAKRQPRCVLAVGEGHGHVHEILDGAALFVTVDGRHFVDVFDEYAILEHTGAPGDHGCFALPRGRFERVIQREFAVGGERRVID